MFLFNSKKKIKKKNYYIKTKTVFVINYENICIYFTLYNRRRFEKWKTNIISEVKCNIKVIIVTEEGINKNRST